MQIKQYQLKTIEEKLLSMCYLDSEVVEACWITRILPDTILLASSFLLYLTKIY